jgi:hypothetical protein
MMSYIHLKKQNVCRAKREVPWGIKVHSHVHKGHTVSWWLRDCATSWKVTGSRPDEVNEIFQFN